MKYTVENGVHVIACTPFEFSIHVVSQAKKNCKYQTYANGGFFWGFSKSGVYVTYPITHLVADIDVTNPTEIELLKSMGKIIGNKYTYDNGKNPNGDQFLNRAISTFYIKGDRVGITDMVTMPESYNYAISGVPVIKNGQDVSFYNYVKQQGWRGDELRATCHTFIGIREGENSICLMSWKSKTNNLIYGMEAFNVFSKMGFSDVIKLDGGGSQILNVNGQTKMQTSENRVINNIVVITPQVAQKPVSNVKTSWDKACAKGLLDGTRPKDSITREELAIVLDRLNLI